ncbi:hypothetical protein H5410_003652 [Solanum commersonii]|uniref:Uncharacterized protein n=1 Tax=Solanum commersonii TaxID=4109 RepID=A0A9J6B685_SOLCO|nr:hypothetical protein H5410_003652 [Solanum commersonii]
MDHRLWMYNMVLIELWFICTVMDLSLDILYGLIMEKVMDWMVSFIIRCLLMYIIWLHHMAKLGLNKLELNMVGLNMKGFMK